MQFGINKHEKIFLTKRLKTNKTARARRASAIWGLWKIYKCLFIPNCTRKIMSLLINNIYEKVLRCLSRRKQKKNCAIQGVRLIWKQKIWLAICEFLFREFCVNQFNFNLFALNFNFLHCLGLLTCSQPKSMVKFLHVYYYISSKPEREN